MHNATKIHWLYDEQTGAIPFIINNDNTKVKNLIDKKIFELDGYPTNYNAKELGASKLRAYYNIPNAEELTSETIISLYLTYPEWFLLFRGKASSEVLINETQVKMMTAFFNHEKKKLTNKAKRQKQKTAHTNAIVADAHEF